MLTTMQSSDSPDFILKVSTLDDLYLLFENLGPVKTREQIVKEYVKNKVEPIIKDNFGFKSLKVKNHEYILKLQEQDKHIVMTDVDKMKEVSKILWLFYEE